MYLSDETLEIITRGANRVSLLCFRRILRLSTGENKRERTKGFRQRNIQVFNQEFRLCRKILVF